jgi:DNA polymerase III subunit gamma/tau
MDGIKGRPLTFEEVIGQEKAKRLIVNSLEKNRISRAYLFSGAWSVGKTTLASLFARSLLCRNRNPQTQSPCNSCPSCISFLKGNHHSYTEVDAANFGTKENMASILGTLAYENEGGNRVIFLDEAHMISAAGKDALLKELETPITYDETIFMFSTNEPEKIPKTLMSRLVRVPLDKPSAEDVYQKIKGMCDKEGETYDTHALKNLASWSQGHYRDAENALGPLVLMGGITLENVASYTSYDVERVSSLLILLEKDLSKALNLAEEITGTYGAGGVHASLVRALLSAIQYGLSGMIMDIPECVKEVYKVYGARMSPILMYLLERDKNKDANFLQAEMVLIHYKFLKGDFDRSTTPEKNVSLQGTDIPSNKYGEKVIVATADQQRALKAAARKKGSDFSDIEEDISKKWGPEEASEAVTLKRS